MASIISPIMSWLQPSGSTDARKTVTFGDASAVRSLPLWSTISLLALLAFWYLSTRAWGVPDAFVDANPGLSDKDLLAACDRDEACADSYFQLTNPRRFPSPRDTINAMRELWNIGYANTTLWGHASASLWRVLRGIFWGIVIGVPVGFAMGLSSRLRGFFDTPVELFRPIPPLALIPLFILIFRHR